MHRILLHMFVQLDVFKFAPIKIVYKTLEALEQWHHGKVLLWERFSSDFQFPYETSEN